MIHGVHDIRLASDVNRATRTLSERRVFGQISSCEGRGLREIPENLYFCESFRAGFGRH